MRDGTQLGNEQRQRSQGYDAKSDAMRPFEQGQPITMNCRMLPLSVQTGNRLSVHGQLGWYQEVSGQRRRRAVVDEAHTVWRCWTKQRGNARSKRIAPAVTRDAASLRLS
jgi:hypothetical protein